MKKYLQQITGKSDLERTSIGKERGKTGVSLGSLAKHPITNEYIPIWIADYVLSNYGTGAIMAVPAHDERDYEFATLFNLPVVSHVSEELHLTYFPPSLNVDCTIRT